MALLSSYHRDVGGSTKLWDSSICLGNSKQCFKCYLFTLNTWSFLGFLMSIMSWGYIVLLVNGLI